MARITILVTSYWFIVLTYLSTERNETLDTLSDDLFEQQLALLNQWFESLANSTLFDSSSEFIFSYRSMQANYYREIYKARISLFYVKKFHFFEGQLRRS